MWHSIKKVWSYLFDKENDSAEAFRNRTLDARDIERPLFLAYRELQDFKPRTPFGKWKRFFVMRQVMNARRQVAKYITKIR